MATKPKRPRADNPAKKRVKKSTTSKSKKPLKSTSKSKKPINDQKAATKAYKRQAKALAKSGAMAGAGASAIKKASATKPMTASQTAYKKGTMARNATKVAQYRVDGVRRDALTPAEKNAMRSSARNPKKVTNTSRMVKREMGSFSKQPAGSFTKTPLEEKRFKKTPL